MISDLDDYPPEARQAVLVALALDADNRPSDLAESLGISRYALRRLGAAGRRYIVARESGGRTCEVCGGPLPLTSRSSRLACSTRCRVARHRAAHRATP